MKIVNLEIMLPATFLGQVTQGFLIFKAMDTGKELGSLFLYIKCFKG